MKRMPHKIVEVVISVLLCSVLLQGCGSVTIGPADGSTAETPTETGAGEVTTEESTTEEITTEESMTEVPTTDEPAATEESPTEELPTEEQSTQEPVPYEEALGEYFAKWEEMYVAEENAGFPLEAWEYIQGWQKDFNIKVVTAKITYSVAQILGESDGEVRLFVDTGFGLEYICDGHEDEKNTAWGGLPHIIRLAKTQEGFEISSDSWWDMVYDQEAGLEEDIEWLKNQKKGDPLSEDEKKG